jgi:hypothetical protein
LGLTTAAFTWTLAIAGIIIAVLAVWSVAERSAMSERSYAGQQ